MQWELAAGRMARVPRSLAIDERLLALQRSHGNAAVTNFLHDRRSRPRVSIGASVRRGGRGPEIPGWPASMLKEDELVIRARVRDPKGPVYVRIDHAHTGLKVGEGSWQGDTYMVAIRGVALGAFPLEIP